MNYVFWTRQAFKSRENVIGEDKRLRQCFMATEQTLRELYYPTGKHKIDVLFTKYQLEIEVDRDKVLRISSITVSDVQEK